MRKVMLVGAALMAACGDDGGQVQVDAKVASIDAAIDAPIDAPACAGGKTLFLNRAGGTYNGAPADDATLNNTKVLGTDTYAVPAYPYGDPSWSSIKTCVTMAFAPFNVVVTDVDPGTAPHHELVFTTTYNAWPG